MTEINAITAIAYRDLLKLLRDPARIIATFIFPLLFIIVLGGSMQASFGSAAGYNLLVVTFTGVFAQTLFQSTATGVVSLIEDRESDFSQEIFVSPISRYSIIFGKVVGESLVALPQAIGIVIFGLVGGVTLNLAQMVSLVPVGITICLFGGAFGVLILSNLSSQRAANQVFPFIMLPQLFIAGVFAPLSNLPWYLGLLSAISPMRYAVDLARGVFYAGHPDYDKVVLQSPAFNLAVIGLMFAVFLVIGTFLFVRRERNK
jgi:ABC-2 type transport system permease protein